MATWGPIQLRLKGSRQVEFDGEASPAPGGGSTPEQLVSVRLTAEQILALDPADPATWPELLPALDGRRYYVIHKCILHLRAGATPFNADLSAVALVGPTYNGDPDACQWGYQQPWNGTSAVDTYSDMQMQANGLSGLQNTPSELLEQAPVLLWFDDQLVSGDGTLSIRLFYTVINGAPPALEYTAQPQDAVAGETMAPVTVLLTDANGDPAASGDVTVTAPGSDLAGTTTKAVVAGVATFDDLVITTGGAFTLTAQALGIPAIESDSFTIGPAADAQLSFSQSPTSTTADTVIDPPITVYILDPFGNQTASTANVHIAGTAGDPVLAGTTTHAAVAGVATFNDITVHATGMGYTTDATSAGLTPATSGPFDIS